MTRSHPEADHPCDCHLLDSMADEPDVPIVFDAETNEYQLRYGDSGGKTPLYYCWFCGGRLPDSRRDRLFARITMAETKRLRELVQDIKTMDDAIRILGQPDSDLPDGESTVTSQGETEPQQIRSYRVTRYLDLSETAVVEITDHKRDRVDIRFRAKHLKTDQTARSAEEPVRTGDSPALNDQAEGRETIYCSFCGLSHHGVNGMLRGSSGAICSDCTEIAYAELQQR